MLIAADSYIVIAALWIEKIYKKSGGIPQDIRSFGDKFADGLRLIISNLEEKFLIERGLDSCGSWIISVKPCFEQSLLLNYEAKC